MTRRRGPVRRRARARWSALVLVFALAMLSARPARARLMDDPDALVGVLFLGMAGVDVSFISMDVVSTAKGQRPKAWLAGAEVVLATPQALLSGGGVVGAEIRGEGGLSVAMISLATSTGTLATHGIWSFSSASVRPVTLFFVSPAIAANAALTSTALARGFGYGRLFSAPLAIAEIAFTVPQVIGSSVRLATSDEDRAGWIALTAWSSALVLHGALSLALGETDPGRPSYSDEAMATARDGRSRAAASFHIAPAMVTDGVRSAPGLVAQGIF